MHDTTLSPASCVARFLDEAGCTNQGESDCAVNKDGYGINLPDGVATDDVRVCGEIKATNNLKAQFREDADNYPDLKW